MNKSLFIIAAAGLFFTSCKKKDKDEVVSMKHEHTYGYVMSETEWNEKQPPGKVYTTFRDGRTITEAYEDSLLHGERVITFAHSTTPHIKELYNKGILTKRTQFSIRGIPEKETTYTSPTHHKVTRWHATGTPLSKEEYVSGKLANGQYFTTLNETISTITEGNGEKVHFNLSGDIIAKDIYVNHDIAYKETYHQNGTPESIVSFKNGKKHGELKRFASSGEPIVAENYANDLRDGLCIYYQNGSMYRETEYVKGLKQGLEKLYIDGKALAEETEYTAGLKHGASVVYCDGTAKTSWFFKDAKVSKSTFDQYIEREYMISSAQR